MQRQIRFGIPSLDHMLNLRAGEDDDRGPSERITLLGPDGTGKSIFALHLVSAYRTTPLEEEKTDDPIVLYVSTDMEYDRAKTLWKSFALGIPSKRAVPFRFPPSTELQNKTRECDLRLLTLDRSDLPCTVSDPNGPHFLAQYLSPTTPDEQRQPTSVGFLDLATHTAGDDWSFVARLLKLGGARSTKSARNLLVVDSVAGFETLVGRTDAFGRESSRRERIAQFIRAAGEDWHIVFVVEDPKPGEHSPEEFVTDTVIRLRRHSVGMHARLTLEIEKSRSNSHPRGEHPFEIRNGKGSCTGDWQNPDDPLALQSDGKLTNAYIEVFPSLHHINRETACEVGQLPKIYAPPGKVCSFNIPCLDSLLVKHADDDRYGLAAGSVTGLLGDDGTKKSLLARHFLMGCFQRYRSVLGGVLTGDAGPPEASAQSLGKMLKKIFLDVDVDDKAKIGTLTSQLKNDTGEFVAAVKQAASRQDLARRFYEQAFVQLHRDDGTSLGCKEAVQKAKAEIESSEQIRFSQPVDDELLERCLGNGDLDTFLRHVWKQSADLTAPGGSNLDDARPYTRLKYPNAWYSFTCDEGAALPIRRVRVVNWLFLHPAATEPAVLLTTRDERPEELAEQIGQKMILPVLKQVKEFTVNHREGGDLSRDGKTAYAECLLAIARRLICRRLPGHDTPAPVLVHIVEKSLEEAMKLRFGPSSLAVNRLDLSARRTYKTRVVIDDLRVAAGTLSDFKNDELLLPYLVFRLQRLGVTTLLVGTYPGRPDAQPIDSVDAALRTLTDHQIHTWKVSFYGHNRVAITVIPAMSERHSDVVRELQGGGRGAELDLTVNPHFEIYSGIEQGQPTPVPLEIRLFVETRAFEKYISQEEGFWRQRFTPYQLEGISSSCGVLRPVNAQEVNDMRALCHLPNDELRPNTLLFQVDGYWARSGGALMNRSTYLTEELPTHNEGLTRDTTTIVDPFGIFRPTRASENPVKTTRLEYFNNSGYKNRLVKEDKAIDRVPFLWDFGFLMCRTEAWERAREVQLRNRSERECPLLVGHVWEEMLGTRWSRVESKQEKLRRRAFLDLNPLPGKLPPSSTSWRTFLEACQLVAIEEGRRLARPIVAFDLSAISPDSICCLVLEIWASEIYEKLLKGKGVTKAAEFLGGVSAGKMKFADGNNFGLCDWLEPEVDGLREPLASLRAQIDAGRKDTETDPAKILNKHPGFILELLKTWLLLTEVLNFQSFISTEPRFHFKAERVAEREAVAARHWYKTACSQLARNDGGVEQEIHRPTPLPGHFSVRGDWFMAVAQGSRSERLADLALDILSSRRGNITRLQEGLGLPVRDILPDNACGQIRTPVVISRNPTETATYGEIVQLGGHHKDEECSERRKDLYWFWRCGLDGYDRQSRVWQSWLNRLFEWTVVSGYYRQAGWEKGFEIYDLIEQNTWPKDSKDKWLLEFIEQCAVLVAVLRQASRATETTSGPLEAAPKMKAAGAEQ